VAVSFYVDVHIPRPVTDTLRRHGAEVLTSQEDGTQEWNDERLLARATEMGRVLVTQDEDLLAISHGLQSLGEPFAGVIYSHQLDASIGELIRDLELIANAGWPEDHRNRVVYLPF
jgi:predicted nuclease of predicted toxin-antitoxin system